MSCFILSCKSHTARKPEDGELISYHRIPVESKTKEQWLTVIPRAKSRWKRHTRICSKHFEDSCFLSGGKYRRLKPDAVPSLYLHSSKEYSETLNKKHLLEENNKKKLAMLRNQFRPPHFQCCVPLRIKIGHLERTLNHLKKVCRQRFLKVNALRNQCKRLKKTNLQLMELLEEKNEDLETYSSEEKNEDLETYSSEEEESEKIEGNFIELNSPEELPSGIVPILLI